MLLSTPSTAHLLSSSSSPSSSCPPTNPNHRHHLKLRAPISSLHSPIPKSPHAIRFSPLSYRHHPRCLVAVSSLEEAALESPENDGTEVKDDVEEKQGDEEVEEIEDTRLVVEGPRLVLKFRWMEKNIALGLDRELPDFGTVPLSPYYFWPRKDAWEELKTVLESKPWISQKKMIILLNQATDIINLWQQQSGGGL